MGIFSLAPWVIGILVIATIILMLVSALVAHLGYRVTGMAAYIVSAITLLVVLLTWWTSVDWGWLPFIVIGSMAILAVAGIVLDAILTS